MRPEKPDIMKMKNRVEADFLCIADTSLKARPESRSRALITNLPLSSVSACRHDRVTFTHATEADRTVLRDLARGQSPAHERAGIHHAVRIAGRGAAVGASHRQGREQGDAPAVPGGQHAAGDPGPGR